MKNSRFFRRRNTLKSLIVLFLAILMTDCQKLKEDNSDCGIWLKFEYKLFPGNATAQADRFPESVQKITVYVFDEVGNLFTTIEKEGPFPANYRLHLNLPAGTYNFVVWGDLSDGTPITVGAGRINDQILKLKTTGGTSELVETHPEPLYFGDKRGVDVKLLKNEEVLISMMKDTKKVDVVLNGVPATSASSGTFVVRIEANNGDYNFQNSPVALSRKLTYVPQRTFVNATPTVKSKLTAEFVTMRLFDYNATTKESLCHSWLIIEYIPADGGPIQTLLNESLIKLIYEEKIPGTGTLKYPNVNFIIDDYFILEFDLNFTFTNWTIRPAGWKDVDSPGGVVG